MDTPYDPNRCLKSLQDPVTNKRYYCGKEATVRTTLPHTHCYDLGLSTGTPLCEEHATEARLSKYNLAHIPR